MFTMDGPKPNLSEGVPLNSGGTNIFLGKTSKLNTDGTTIHLNAKENSAEVGVHINTTLAVASSKKIKLLFILNFLFSVICMALSTSVAFYYWNEISSMRRQMDMIKDHVLLQSIESSQDKISSSPLVSPPRLDQMEREPRRFPKEILANGKKYYVENLGEDVLFRDVSKKVQDRNTAIRKDLAVIHFNGATGEHNLQSQRRIGPWSLDRDVSTNNSEEMIELNTNYLTIKESGVYIVYSQVMYITKMPNCYFIFAQQPGQNLRQLAACATGDDSTGRSIEKSHISCSVQTVARLHQGDNVHISQREHNMTVSLQEGYTYLGFVKISS